jgi:uncharacterized SAM-binding protein YcdF (DUF218 family)
MISFAASKILTLLVYPLSTSLLLCLLALLLMLTRFTRTACCTLLFATAWLWLCSTALFADYLMGTLERGVVPRAMSAIAPEPAIVLLGGAMRGDTHMGTFADLNEQADRLVYAVALYKAGKAPLLLLTGGAIVGGRTEAEQMRDLLAVMGIPDNGMLLENQSRDTHDNAVFSAKTLKERGIHRVLLVTSAFHMRRAVALFEAQGIEVVPAPTDYQQLVSEAVVPGWLPMVSNLSRSTHALHEMIGYQIYRWRAWL